MTKLTEAEIDYLLLEEARANEDGFVTLDEFLEEFGSMEVKGER